MQENVLYWLLGLTRSPCIRAYICWSLKIFLTSFSSGYTVHDEHFLQTTRLFPALLYHTTNPLKFAGMTLSVSSSGLCRVPSKRYLAGNDGMQHTVWYDLPKNSPVRLLGLASVTIERQIWKRWRDKHHSMSCVAAFKRRTCTEMNVSSWRCYCNMCCGAEQFSASELEWNKENYQHMVHGRPPVNNQHNKTKLWNKRRREIYTAHIHQMSNMTPSKRVKPLLPHFPQQQA